MRKLIAAAAVATSMAFAPAHAAVLDFANDADVNGERGVANGGSVTIDGETVGLVTYSGTAGARDGAGGNPYLDASSGGKPGGLGVCQTLGVLNNVANQCDPSNDDSIQEIGNTVEGVGIRFNRVLDVLALSFNDFAHDEINAQNDGMVELWTNEGSPVGIFSFSDLISMAAGGDAVFQDISFIAFVFVDLAFYVNAVTVSDVPIPGALPLLLSGLAGLGFASRKKKKLAA